MIGLSAGQRASRFIVAPERMNAEGDPIAVALRAQYKQVRMPNLDLTPGDAAVIIDYLDRQSRAVRAAASAGGTAAANPAASVDASRVDLAPLLKPYLRIQQALHADTVDRVNEDARLIAVEAAKLGSAGRGIHKAAGQFDEATDLASARLAIGALSDAILIFAREHNVPLGSDVKVAYCPMAQKYWLQQGETIENPFYGRRMSDCGRITLEIPSVR